MHPRQVIAKPDMCSFQAIHLISVHSKLLQIINKMNFCHTGCLSDKECGKEICSTPTDNDPTRHTNNCPHDKCCQPVVCKSSLPETSGGELSKIFEQPVGLVCDQGKVINPFKHLDPELSQPLKQVILLCVKKHDANNSTSGEWELINGLSVDHIQCTEGRLASTLLYLLLQT